ncbi:MAG: ferredoxin [Sporichthyaceae bacterium]
MKHLVDTALCSGHGACAAEAPDVYDLDDEGFNSAAGVEVEVAAGLEQQAVAGAEACPDQAIRILA